MGPLQAIRSVLGHQARFGGRASRSEFWWWVLLLVLVGTVQVALALSVAGGAPLPVPGELATQAEVTAWLSDVSTWLEVSAEAAGPVLLVQSVLGLVFLIPTLAVFVRRLHDAGRSGWWWLALVFLPVIGQILVLIFPFLDSTPGPNRWGPPPAGSRYADPATWASRAPVPAAADPGAPAWAQQQAAAAPPAASWQSVPQQP